MRTFYAEEPTAVQYEPIPTGTVVYFRENIQPSEPIDGTDSWEADEYALAVKAPEDKVRQMVEANRPAWMERAKTATNEENRTDMAEALRIMGVEA